MLLIVCFKHYRAKTAKKRYTCPMQLSAPQLLFDARAELGEGPAWDSARQRLYWVDIYTGLLHIFNPIDNEDEVIDMGQPLGCVAPAIDGGKARCLDFDPHAKLEDVARPLEVADVVRDLKPERARGRRDEGPFPFRRWARASHRACRSGEVACPPRERHAR